MPGRGREAAGWADGEFTNRVNELAKTSRSLPDQNAKLRLPSELSLHPEGLPRPTLNLWAGQPSRPVEWVHVTVETRDRRARAVAYMDGSEPASIVDWLEALMTGADPIAGCISALEVASSLARIEPGVIPQIRRAKILLDEAGEQCSIGDGIFRRAPIPVEVEARYVHPKVEVESDEYLRNLDVRKIDTERLLEVKLRERRHEWKAPDWDLFWEIVRETSQQAVMECLRAARINPLSIKVRNVKGDYQSIGVLLLPGEIAHEGSVDDTKAIIDTHFHADELSTIRLLGATSGPSRNGGRRSEPWFLEYRRQARRATSRS